MPAATRASAHKLGRPVGRWSATHHQIPVQDGAKKAGKPREIKVSSLFYVHFGPMWPVAIPGYAGAQMGAYPQSETRMPPDTADRPLVIRCDPQRKAQPQLAPALTLKPVSISSTTRHQIQHHCMNQPGKPAPCLRCQHYFVTHEVSHQHGCRALGFKGPQMPFRIVLQASGTDCQYFTEKPVPSR